MYSLIFKIVIELLFTPGIGAHYSAKVGESSLGKAPNPTPKIYFNFRLYLSLSILFVTVSQRPASQGFSNLTYAASVAMKFSNTCPSCAYV